MHSALAKALTLTHDVFRCGVPRLKERNIIPIRTSAHFIAFDADRISPLYTMIHVTPENAKVNVERKDNFFDGDITLPDHLCTKESDYKHWNQEHPEFQVDKGHSLGSQFARANSMVQSDVDTLAGVTPEASGVNRNIKGPLESAIKAYANTQTHSWIIQGPVWYGKNPKTGKLRNGQWIPDALWINCCFLRNKTIEAWAFLMENLSDKKKSDLRQVTQNQLSHLTGLVFWDNVGSSAFYQKRNSCLSGDWWKSS